MRVVATSQTLRVDGTTLRWRRDDLSYQYLEVPGTDLYAFLSEHSGEWAVYRVQARDGQGRPTKAQRLRDGAEETTRAQKLQAALALAELLSGGAA